MIKRNVPLPRQRKPIRKRRKAKKSSLRWENVNDEYMLFPDGRKVHFETNKGQMWYFAQVYAMAVRQKWVCGFKDSGNCEYPGLPMSEYIGGNLTATFEHWNKRGAGKKNDDINTGGNCAVHFICNCLVGSRRIKPV